MSARPARPRSREQHEAAAGEVLRRHALGRGWRPQLPVPVEQIVEATCDLSIEVVALEEGPGERVLGALDPTSRTIYLNQRHIEFFGTWVGPERFTVAHELGHWRYDAVDPSQQQLPLSDDGGRVFCRHVDDAGIGPAARLREVNANGFASCLLLPSDLVRAEVAARFESWSALRERANDWGVSGTTLRIRLEALGLGWAVPNQTGPAGGVSLWHNT